MRSKEERAADFARREAKRKALYAERMGRIREKSAALKAAQEPEVDQTIENGIPELKPAVPKLYFPSVAGSLAAAVIPGLGIYQTARAITSQHEMLKSMTPAERSEFLKFNQGSIGI